MSEIKVEHVEKSYGTQKVVKDVSLSIHTHERVSIIGGSGSGKTTLLKMINALILPDHGSVYIDGRNIKEMNPNILRQGIGYVIQSIALFPHMTIEENIAYVLHLKKEDHQSIQKRILELLKIVDLKEELLRRYPDELSGGQKQRV